MVFLSEEYTLKKDFTFQVATTERHKPRGDEVVHILACTAHVFFTVVTWWDKKIEKVFQ